MAASKVLRDILSVLVLIGVAVNMIRKVATGNNHAVGSAAGEMELLDSSTGKRLVGAVDSRSGTKYTGKYDKWGKWNHTKDACDYRAERIAIRLDELSEAGYILKGSEK